MKANTSATGVVRRGNRSISSTRLSGTWPDKTLADSPRRAARRLIASNVYVTAPTMTKSRAFVINSVAKTRW